MQNNKNEGPTFETIHVTENDVYYDMDHEYRGIAVIINNDTFKDAEKLPNRKGTNEDVQSLTLMLLDLHFEVLVWNNYNYKDLKAGLTKLAKKDHSKNDCLVIVVMTYGIDNTPYIYAKNKKYSIELLWSEFTPDICPTLAEKPKMFFIHAPCVDVFDSDVTASEVTNIDAVDFFNDTYKIPIYTHFLIIFNSYSGYISFKYPDKGSLFIQSLCIELSKHDLSTTDILKIMTRVSKQIALMSQNETSLYKQKRVPITQSMLIRNVYFKPKMGSPAKPEINRNFIPEEYPQKENVSSISTTIIEETKSFDHQLIHQMTFTKYASCYKMDHECRGYAVIIHNDNFEGAAKHLPDRNSSRDIEYLQTMFHNMSFEILIWSNLYYQDLMVRLTKLAEEDHSKNDSLAVVVLTHGIKSSLIYAKDRPYPVEFLWDTFSADKCPTLAGKPKMFFIQACRGDKLDCGVILSKEINTEVDNSITYYPIPTQYADFLIVFSSYDGYTSFRNPENGSWFIQSLHIETKKNDVATTDILSIMTCVSRRVALNYSSYNKNPLKNDQKQLPTIYSTLIGDLYFKMKPLPDSKLFNKTSVSLISQREEHFCTTIEEKFLSSQPSNTTAKPKISNFVNIYNKTNSDAMKPSNTAQFAVTKDTLCSNIDHEYRGVQLHEPPQELTDMFKLVPDISALNITVDQSASTCSTRSQYSNKAIEDN